MSIATAITDLSGRIQLAYDALEEKGATMPAVRNTANMPAAIDSISTGVARDSTTKLIAAWGAQINNMYTSNIQGELNRNNWNYNQTLANVYILYAYIGEGVTSIAAQLFKQASIYLLDLPTTLTSIGDYAFDRCNKLSGELSLPNGLESIGTYAFYYCSGLTSVTIPPSVTSIGNWAFYSCDSLLSVEIPNSMTSIGTGVFYNCRGLTSVVIPDSVTSIAGDAFGSCGSLASVTIPASVTSIGDNAFNGCSHNFTITLEGKTVAQIQAMNPELWFGWTDMTITLVGTDGSYVITISCLLKGTDILLADGTTKKIENLTYNDVLKVWDFDEGQLGSAKVCWLVKPGLKNKHYYQLTFDDGTVLKTTGINSNHRIFSVDKNKFTNVADAKVGDKVYSINGVLTITDVQRVEEECEYYNVITSEKINCFANGILTSDRYGNMYPIDSSMKYVKDGRTIRPYSDYEAVGISRYWYDNFRLGEVPETVEKSKEYVMKCEGQMLPLPAAQSEN